MNKKTHPLFTTLAILLTPFEKTLSVEIEKMKQEIANIKRRGNSGDKVKIVAIQQKIDDIESLRRKAKLRAYWKSLGDTGNLETRVGQEFKVIYVYDPKKKIPEEISRFLNKLGELKDDNSPKDFELYAEKCRETVLSIINY